MNPYPYPWVRNQTHTYGLVPIPKVTFAVLVLHKISYIVLYMLWGKGWRKIRI